MGDQSTSFDAGVIAALAIVLGVAYVIGGALALLSDGRSNVLLLLGSVPVTMTIGVLLALSAGLLATGERYGRYLGVMAFGAVVLFGRPSLSGPEALDVIQASASLLAALYMTLRDPIPKPERSHVDESESATKVGSTIR